MSFACSAEDPLLSDRSTAILPTVDSHRLSSISKYISGVRRIGCIIPASVWKPSSQQIWHRNHFNSGISILVAHKFPGDIHLEWNFGYFGTNDPDALDTLSESYLGVSWALQKQLSKKLAVFYQGFYNGANGNFFPADLVSGLGGYWSATQRLGLFATYNWSLDKMGSPSGGYIGFAYAY